MKKKLLSLGLVLVLLLNLIPGFDLTTKASAKYINTSECVTSGNWEYLEDKENYEAIVVGYKGLDKNVVIPSTLGGMPVTGVKGRIFGSNNKTESITIPQTVTYLDNISLMGRYLKKIYIDPSNPVYSSENGILFDKEQKVLLCYPYNIPGNSYTIPNTVTTIGKDAFSGTDNLHTIIIPDSVQSIEEYAFSGCEKLSSINLPDGIKSINDGLFAYCISLSSVGFPSELTYIGNEAFLECDSLISMAIPDGVTEIGFCAFEGCDKLTSVDIPGSVEWIEEDAFSGCFNLKKINLSKGITYIDRGAFEYCKSLESITIPETVVGIGFEAFDGCSNLKYIDVADGCKNYCSQDGVLYDKSKTELIKYPATKKDTKYTIPSTVETIMDYALEDCSNLKTVVLPSTVNNIGIGAFSNCYNLTSMTIPKGVEVIRHYTFQNCSNLSKVTIPSTLKEIYYGAFLSCKNLSSLVLDKNNTSFTLVNGVLFDKNKTKLILYPAKKQGTSYSVPSTVKSIGNYAFDSSVYLKTISIPKSVKSIDFGVFKDCYALQNVNVDKNNTAYYVLDGVVFTKGMNDLVVYPAGRKQSRYTIPSKVSYIREYAFNGCKYLKEIVELGNIVDYDREAFNNCKGLTIYTPKGSYMDLYRSAKGLKYKYIATKITIEASKKTILTGQSVSLKAVLKPSNTVSTVTWKSSNNKIATVTNKGVVKGVKAGKVTITASSMGGITAKITLTIKQNVKSTSVKLNKTKLTLKKGKTYQLKTTLKPLKSTDQISYQSSNKKIATVSSKGKVKALKKGKVTITAKTSNGKKAKCVVTVN